MNEDLRERRKLVIGVECKKWFEDMLFIFTDKKVNIPEDVAFSMFMQGQAMCAFGEYILDPTDDNLLFLNNTVYAIGENFKF